jgi:O-acetyl-ADP-ribose deacetylase
VKAKVNKVTIRIARAETLTQSVDAIVQVTDTNLSLKAALSEKGGLALARACQEIGWCRVGSAVITTAGNLPFQKIIHAVAPRWGEGHERARLSSVTLKCLQLAEENGIRSLALPAISTGTLGYPVEGCARVMLEEIIDFTFEDLRHLRTIVLCLDSRLTHDVFVQEFSRMVRGLQVSGEGKVKV